MELQKELVPIEKTVALVSKKVADLVIKDAETMATASEYRSQLKDYVKSIKEKKAEVLDPLNEALKKFKSMFKPLEDKCEANLEIIDSKMIAFQTAKIEKERQEEAKIVAKIESGKIDMDKAVDKLAKIDRVEKKVETDSGSTSFVEHPCFEVENMATLPIEYHLADEVKIRAAMKAGIRLPGVRYWTEQRPRNSR